MKKKNTTFTKSNNYLSFLMFIFSSALKKPKKLHFNEHSLIIHHFNSLKCRFLKNYFFLADLAYQLTLEVLPPQAFKNSESLGSHTFAYKPLLEHDSKK